MIRTVPLTLTFVLYLIGLGMTNSTDSSDVAQEATKSRLYFVFAYSPGPAWDKGKSIFEQPLEGHFKYMDKLEKEGKLIIGGPFKDGSGAIGIIEAVTLEVAQDLVNNDPGVKDSLFLAEVKAWFPAVVGCIVKKDW